MEDSGARYVIWLDELRFMGQVTQEPGIQLEPDLVVGAGVLVQKASRQGNATARTIQ